VPFRWRDRNTRPMEIVQVRLDLIRAGLCLGVSCMRLARRECRAICAYPADGDAPTVVFTVSPAFTPDALDAAS